MADRLLETFLTLVRFNTPSRQEAPASQWCGDYLRDLGFSVAWDGAGEALGGTVGNLIATLPDNVAGAPPLLFSSHLDTVEPTPDLEIAIDGDTISAASDTILGADDKCGVAPILEAMTRLVESGAPHGEIQVLLTICEEIGLKGAKQLDPSRLSARYGYVLDAGPPVGTITNAAPAQNSLYVRIDGVPAHAGLEPEKGVSAIVAAANALHAMRLGRIDAETTANVGTFHGGQARNIVAPQAELVCEARSRNQDKLDAQTAHMVETFEREAAAIGAVARVEVVQEYVAYRFDETNPVIALALRAANAVCLTPALKESGGGSDANILNGLGIPTAVLATGMERIHTHDEFCRLSDMEKDVAWILAIVAEAAKG